MKAIVTKYIPSTNTRGSRIRAYAEGVKPHTVPYDYGAHNPHAVAALELARRMEWTGTLIEGGLPDGRGCVFVFADGEAYSAYP